MGDNRVDMKLELLFGTSGHRTQRRSFRLSSMLSDDLQDDRKYSHPFSHMGFSSCAYGMSRKLHHDTCQHVFCCCAATCAKLYIKLNLRSRQLVRSVSNTIQNSKSD